MKAPGRSRSLAFAERMSFGGANAAAQQRTAADFERAVELTARYRLAETTPGENGTI